jgi:hypothetical protein
METLLRLAMHAFIGIGLFVANVWFIQSLLDVYFRHDIVIAPLVISGAEGEEKALGPVFAQLLQVRLGQLQRQLQDSLSVLTRQTPGDRGLPAGAGSAAPSARAKLPFTEPVNLPTALLQLTEVSVNVGGVEVGKLLPWLQRSAASSRTLTFTVHHEKDRALVAADLSPLGGSGPSTLWLTLPSASSDTIIDAIAFELIRRAGGKGRSDTAFALEPDEFRSLTEYIIETARLSEKAAAGRPMQSEFAGLLQKVEMLVSKVPDWQELNLLAGRIADSANDRASALQFYAAAGRVGGASSGGTGSPIVAAAEAKVRELEIQLPPNFSDLARRIIGLVARFETGATSIDEAFRRGLFGNVDGQGLTLGVAGWNLAQGSLQELLRQYRAADEIQFRKVFGDGTEQLERIIEAPTQEALDWARSIQDAQHNIEEPWKSRFLGLGLVRAFQDVQISQLERLFRRAIVQADEFGVRSERALALLFDIIVQNGPISEVVRAQIHSDIEKVKTDTKQPPDELTRLRIIANRRSEAARPQWIDAIRLRKLTIANGVGDVGGQHFDLEKDGITLRDFRTGELPRASG